MRARRGSLVLAAGLALAACGGAEPAGAPSPSPSPDTSPSGSTETTAPPAPPETTVLRTPRPDQPPEIPRAVGTTTGAAVADLAERLGVPPDSVQVVRDVEVTWRDASNGCPVDGMAYAQVLTDGRLVELEVDGTRYEYHSGGSRGLAYCPSPQPPLEVHG